MLFDLNDGKSYGNRPTSKSDKKHMIITCKEPSCKFQIQITSSKKGVKIAKMIPHSYTPAIYYKSKPAHSMWYLKHYHCALIINNQDITPSQIQSDERLWFSNEINYQQAYRVKQALLEEIERLEADCFAQILAYLGCLDQGRNKS